MGKQQLAVVGDEFDLIARLVEECLAEPSTPPATKRGRPRWEANRESQGAYVTTQVMRELQEGARGQVPTIPRAIAQRALVAVQWEGLARRVFALARRGQCYITMDGKVSAVNARIGVPTYDAQGKRLKGRQLKFWWEASWDQFLAWLAERRVQLRGHGAVVARMDEVANLKDRYPESKTPGEACALAGVDPRAFDLDELVADAC